MSRPKMSVEFIIASSFRPIEGYTDLRNKRGAVDALGTAITKARLGNKNISLKFQVGRYFLNKPLVTKLLLTKVDAWTVKNLESK